MYNINFIKTQTWQGEREASGGNGQGMFLCGTFEKKHIESQHNET